MFASRYFSNFLLAMSIQFTVIHFRETGLGRTCHRDQCGTTIAKTLPGFSVAECKARQDNDSKQDLARANVQLERARFAGNVKGATQARDQQASTANACAGSSGGVSKTCQSWMLGLRTEQISACVHAAAIRLCCSSAPSLVKEKYDLRDRARLAKCFSADAAKPLSVRDCCGCQDTQFYCEDVDCYNSGGRVMLDPGTFYAAGRCQPYANQRASVPDWRKPNNSRVTLTTTRLCPACHLASAQSCIKQSDQGALCMDALAFRTSSSLFDPPSTHVNRFR